MGFLLRICKLLGLSNVIPFCLSTVFASDKDKIPDLKTARSVWMHTVYG